MVPTIKYENSWLPPTLFDERYFEKSGILVVRVAVVPANGDL